MSSRQTFEEPARGPDGEIPDPANATRFRALSIGRSVVFDGYDVKVRIDDFFGGHTAILGNTGSGKSCTVASILQSLFDKTDEFHARGATFVVFDVNGEYANALSPLTEENGIGVANLVLDGTASEERFHLPHWFLEQSEWELLLQAVNVPSSLSCEWRLVSRRCSLKMRTQSYTPLGITSLRLV